MQVEGIRNDLITRTVRTIESSGVGELNIGAFGQIFMRKCVQIVYRSVLRRTNANRIIGYHCAPLERRLSCFIDCRIALLVLFLVIGRIQTNEFDCII